jgi:hypothetical protein
MPAIDSIRTYSDEALIEAIQQLKYSEKQWAHRLHMLLSEQKRRRKNGIRIPQAELLPL